ncbi:MAG: DDE-type integrase/transposase/recombinase [Acidimicrobiia bacterium]|nr:DDE-type integrase/transposase/recombinase [Acidimicrobiia bacterium]
MTYIWAADRFWYLATVIDASTKEVLGWACADHMRTSLATDALHRAVRRRGGRARAGLVFHSDRGSQYTSAEYGAACKVHGIRQSMGRRGVVMTLRQSRSSGPSNANWSDDTAGTRPKRCRRHCSVGSRHGTIGVVSTLESGTAHPQRPTPSTSNS